MEIRAIRDDEFDTFLAVTEDAFGEPPSKEGAERVVLRASLELDRTRAAYGGKRQVGSSAAYSLQVSVRGGSAAMAGISWIGVAPGHRRRGVLRAMMTALMDQAREREEPLAGLYASEWPIYGRFGFGMAVPQATIRVSLASARPAATRDAEAAEAADEAVAVVDAAEAAPLLAPVYEAVAAQRSGITSRSEDWWRIVLHDFSEDRKELGHRRCAVSRSDGAVDGYVLYHFKADWSRDALPTGKVSVAELVSTSPRATAALWRHVLDTDLASGLEAYWRPVDDPLPLLLADPRRARVSVRDGLFVRVLDLPSAFAARTASAEAAVRIDVRDELVDANNGTWRISAPDGAGAALSCARDGRGAAQLVCDVSALGACYLGGESALRLLDAGVVSGDPQAARRLDALLATDRMPWNVAEF